MLQSTCLAPALVVPSGLLPPASAASRALTTPPVLQVHSIALFLLALHLRQPHSTPPCASLSATPCCLQTTSTIAASQWGSLGVDASFDMARFKQGFSIDIKRYEGDDMEFEMKEVSCAVRQRQAMMASARLTRPAPRLAAKQQDPPAG